MRNTQSPFRLAIDGPFPQVDCSWLNVLIILIKGRNDSKKGASSKTSFNRFSLFVKSGSENFILGKVNLNVPEADALTVVVRTVMQIIIFFKTHNFRIMEMGNIPG